VREFGWFDVMVLSSGTIWVAMAGYSFYIAYFPVLGPNAWIPLALGIGAITSFFYYFGLVFLSIAMPRAGGDYIYTTRIFSKVACLGFMNNLAFVIWSVILMGESVPYVVSLGLVAPSYFLSLQTGNSALYSFATIFSQPNVAFATGVVITILLTLIAIAGARWIKFFNRITLFIAILAFFVLVTVLFSYSNSDFQQAFNGISATTNVTYTGLIQTAGTTGWAPPSYSFQGAMSLIPLSFFTYYGASFGAYYAGEIKQVQKTMFLSTILSILGGFVILGIEGLGSYHLMGDSFFSAVSWLGWGPGAAKNPFPTLPALNALAGLVVPAPYNTWYQLFWGAAMIITYIPWFMTYYMWLTRSMFAWSFDRVMPEKLSKVSERFHTPVLANVAIAIGMIITEAVFIYTTFFYTQFNAFTGLLAVMILPSIVMIVFPFVKKETFNASPSIVKSRVGGVPVLTILGVLATIVTVGSTIWFLGQPLLGPTNPSSFAFFIVVFGVGIVIFYVAKYYRKTQGMDLGLAFGEIPPE